MEDLRDCLNAIPALPLTLVDVDLDLRTVVAGAVDELAAAVVVVDEEDDSDADAGRSMVVVDDPDIPTPVDVLIPSTVNESFIVAITSVGDALLLPLPLPSEPIPCFVDHRLPLTLLLLRVRMRLDNKLHASSCCIF